MRDFKIRKILDFENQGLNKFDVEIEYIDNGDRETYGFPKGNGWRDINPNTKEPKFIEQIKRSIFDKETRKQKDKVKDKMKEIKKFEGNEIKFGDK